MLMSKDYHKGFSDGRRQQGREFKAFILDVFETLSDVNGIGPKTSEKVREHVLEKMDEASTQKELQGSVKK